MRREPRGSARSVIISLTASVLYLGQLALTPGGTGWKTGSFQLPSNVRAALLQARTDVRFGIAVNTPNGAPPVLLDNLHFDGTLVPAVVGSVVDMPARVRCVR